ncbi:helix-turn-helix domain-containing protein [Lentzea chajnantorensis]
MTSAVDPALRLAQRLRELRRKGWPGKRITQDQLARAFDVSVPLISSWERRQKPVLPPEQRLRAYATFFATSRSADREPYRVLSQLTAEEQVAEDALLGELIALRDRALGESPAEDTPVLVDNLWRLPPNEDITIVCSKLPERLRRQLPGAGPDDPDYVELYQYSDLDSLFELHGHIRAMNPTNTVRVRPGAGVLTADESSSHLVLLGGVDWNEITAELLHRIDLPIRQQERPDDTDTSGFEVVADGEVVETFLPKLRRIGDRQVLVEDVAHFYRSRNPFNQKRTVTICNGAYSRGVLGAVRTLTDARFRDRNTAHARTRFAGLDSFSILSRVPVLQGTVITPDWTSDDHLLHEWQA